MKTLTLIIGISLLGTMNCLAQSPKHKFTDAELIKLAGHIKGLESQNNQSNYLVFSKLMSQYSEVSKGSNRTSAHQKGRSLETFTDAEILKLANYIKALEATVQKMPATNEQYTTTLAEINITGSLTNSSLEE